MANHIERYQGNTTSINCTCTLTGIADLTGYTATFTLKKNATDTAVTLTKEGTIADLVITIPLTATNMSLPAGQYVYAITVSDGTNEFSVREDKFTILESVKY